MTSLTTDRLDTGESSAAAEALVSPPAGLRRFDPRPGEGPSTWVDYRSHPAYAPLAAEATPAVRLKSLVMFARYFAVILGKRLVSYELIPAHLRRPRSLAAAWRLLATACRHAARRIAAWPAPRPLDAGGPFTRRLMRDGICVAKVDERHVRAIARAAQPLFDRLRADRGAPSAGRRFEESRGQALRTLHGDLFEAVDTMLVASGVLDGVSSYLGRRASLVDVNPQINDASDDFWQRVFPDLPPQELPAAYLHRDASGGDIKAILYLSDVGPRNGPFGFVVGSHSLRTSGLGGWVEEANDQSGCSASDLSSRQRFAALPAPLRRKCAFGNDLLPLSETAARLVAAEWPVCASRGHLVLFDTKGCHRGGMVAEGERLVLTCVIG